MASDNEPAKLLLPYLQRADELQKAEPLVAYYCRLYAMERGLKIPQSDRTKTTNALLFSLMKQLEKDKKSLTLGPEDNLYLEGFASNVFAKADKQDRAGRADLNTAKTFYASSIFFEILNQFGPLQTDLEQRQKYAVWKAADIRKALKEGRKPLPGPPGGDDDLRVLSSTSSSDLETRTSDFDARPDTSRVDPAAKSVLDSDSVPQVYDHGSFLHSTSIPGQPPNFSPTTLAKALPDSDCSPRMNDQDNLHHSTSIPHHPPNFTPTPVAKDIPDSDQSYHQYDQGNFHHPPSVPSQPSNFVSMPSPSFGIPPSPNYPTDSYSSDNPSLGIPPSPNYPTNSYSSDNPHHQPSVNSSQHTIYHQPYSHQPYQPEPQHHIPQQYPSHEASQFSYPNFQSYPSFTESSLPTAPTHQPSYYQGSEASYANSSPSFTAPFPSTPQHNPISRNGSAPEASPPATHKYEYDSSYQPPPEKIAEAHKAARFAVGALAFDDVSVAVDYLKKSLELLTNPSAADKSHI